MKALTLYQPWASLMALKVKTIETRSWPAPKSLIGQRVAIHASKRRPPVFWHRNINADLPEPYDRYDTSRNYLWTEDPDDFMSGGSYRWVGPLGAIVASGVLADCVPMLSDDESFFMPSGSDLLFVCTTGEHSAIWLDSRWQEDITDQLPYGDFRPGRWAWLFSDLAPTTERCPACWGKGLVPRWPIDEVCLACWKTKGRCDPIPAKGHPRVWEWTP